MNYHSFPLTQLLLAAGATPDPLALDLETPLYFAARYGHVEVSTTDGRKLTEILISLSLSPKQVMRVLIAHKASVDSANTRGGTYVFCCLVLTKFLNASQYDVCLFPRPFHRAVLEGQIAAAKLLISHGGKAVAPTKEK